LSAYLANAGLIIEKRLYPGTVFSTWLDSIRIMRKNNVSPLIIIIKLFELASRKIPKRILRNYDEDVGICLLARKI